MCATYIVPLSLTLLKIPRPVHFGAPIFGVYLLKSIQRKFVQYAKAVLSTLTITLGSNDIELIEHDAKASIPIE
ncbi:MAG: hypothetical protein MJ201_00060 [Mycoplasmoidaceae bacterium]|nr:hypothetical protein [Mycoplasmoidaceae bacterium]